MQKKTRPFHTRIYVDAFYETTVQIPAHFTKEEAIQYVKDHLPDIPLGSLQYIPDSDEIDPADLDNPYAFFFEDEQRKE